MHPNKGNKLLSFPNIVICLLSLLGLGFIWNYVSTHLLLQTMSTFLSWARILITQKFASNPTAILKVAG